MGVHGLWQLLQPSGRPVTLESLEGKVLAVDVSIWLHQTMKGMRDKDGNPLPNAHLQGLFSRVCKLLFYRIKPVFVFDGGVPVLKKQTLAARRERKSEAQRESNEIAKKLLRNLVKSQAVKQALGGGGGAKENVRIPGVSRKGGEKDIFELPPLPESEEIGLAMNSGAWDTEFEQQENWVREGLATLSKVDPDSDEFKSLPMEIQHEALVDLKEERKYHSLSRISKMPEDADDFSSYQLKKLMKVSNLTTRIDDVRKQMTNRTTGELQYELGDDYYGNEVEARRIVSEDASHYILIKGITKQKQMEEAEKYDLERRIKVEKEDDDNKSSADEGSSRLLQSKETPTEILEKSGDTIPLKRSNQGKDSAVRQKQIRLSEVRSNSSGKERMTRSKKMVASTALNNDDEDSDDDNDKDGVDQCESDRHVEEMSSSEDEGFIEVSFNPNQDVQEDELFPASIFVPASDPCTDDAQRQAPVSPSSTSLSEPDQLSFSLTKDVESGKKDFKKYAKNNEKGSKIAHQRSSSRTESEAPGPNSEVTVPEQDIIEKRKSVLSDVLLELQKKKEALNMISAVADDDEISNSDINNGDNVNHDIDDDDNGNSDIDDDDSFKEKDGAKVKHIERELNTDAPLPGGFILEEPSSDSEEVSLKENMDTNKKFNSSDRGTVGKKKRVRFVSDSEEDEIAMTVNERLNDSEDEDLKLAIELSLQTARHEKCVGLEEDKDKRIKTLNGKTGEMSHVKNNWDLNQQTNNDDDDFETVEFPDHDEDNLDRQIKGRPDDKEVHMTNDDNDDVEEEENDDDDVSCGRQSTTSKDDADDMIGMSETRSMTSGVESGKHASSEAGPSKQAQERLQPEDVEDDPFSNFAQTNLEHIQDALQSERAGLMQEQGKQNRFAASLTDQIVLEAQELLSLFGIPFLVSPMEAEAQCAFLDATQQTQGTITDDSDIWLFGGTRVYKNFFNQSKYVEFFSMDSIRGHFGLSRERLIQIALLCGSDYTTGIQGVGPVRALEIMGEFSGDGLSGLMAFRKWWDRSQRHPLIPGESKLKTRLRDLDLDLGFPKQEVMEAYLLPSVDESRERFSWGEPNLDLLKQFAKAKFGWSKDKSDSVLDPMMKQFLQKKTQGRIYSYFQPDVFIPAPTVQSDRLKKALSMVKKGQSSNRGVMRGGTTDGDNSAEEEVPERFKSVISAKSTSKKKTLIDNDKEGMETKKGKKNKGGKDRTKNSDSGDSSKRTEGDGKKKMNARNKRKGEGREEESLPEIAVQVKKEKMDDGYSESQDDFMKDMQNKVAAASSLLAKGKEMKSGRGGRGRGGRQQKSTVIKTPALPSLDIKSRRGKIQGGRTRMSSKNAIVKRGVVCLSESSSSSESDDDDISVGDVYHIGTEFNDFSANSKCKSARDVRRNELDTCENSVTVQKPIEKQKSDNDNSEHEEITKKSKSFQLNHEEMKAVRSDGLKSQKLGNNFSKAKATKSLPASSDSDSIQEAVRRDGLNSQNPEMNLNEAKALKSSHAFPNPFKRREKQESAKEARNRKFSAEAVPHGIAISNTGVISADTPIDLPQCTDEAGMVGQVPGKNPDVSIINALTLKSTLSYLNQRSSDEKQLLNALGGKRSSNAIERRLEEEERKEQWRAKGAKGGNEKEVKKQSQQKRSEPKLSFEDMLGDAEVLISTTQKSNFSKKKKESEKKSLSSDIKQPLHKINEDDSCKANRYREEISEPAKPHRMRSLSDEFEMKEASPSVEGSRASLLKKDQNDKSLNEKEQKVYRSEKSRAFDAPIDTAERVARRQKFELQVDHLWESKSVRGHGILPPQNRVPRGRAIAGKGKGIGKNRSGWQQEQDSGKNTGGLSVTGVLTSSGVTDSEIMEFGTVTLDDLGSDFSDNDF